MKLHYNKIFLKFWPFWSGTCSSHLLTLCSGDVYSSRSKLYIVNAYLHMAYSFQLKLYIESFSWIIEVFYRDHILEFHAMILKLVLPFFFFQCFAEAPKRVSHINLDFIVTTYILEGWPDKNQFRRPYVGWNGSSRPWFNTYPFFLLFVKIMLDQTEFWKKNASVGSWSDNLALFWNLKDTHLILDINRIGLQVWSWNQIKHHFSHVQNQRWQFSHTRNII